MSRTDAGDSPFAEVQSNSQSVRVARRPFAELFVECFGPGGVTLVIRTWATYTEVYRVGPVGPEPSRLHLFSSTPRRHPVARMLLCLVGLSAFTLPPPPAQAEPPAETLIRLSVHPAPAPRPALRYLLLPELKEMTSGNPIPNYLKCILDQDYAS